MKQPYQRHKAAKEAYEFLRGLYNTLDRATRMDANGAKGIFIVRTEADDLKAATKAAADKLQALLEHWSSADTGDTVGDIEAKAATIMEAITAILEGDDVSAFSEDVQKQAAAVLDTTTKTIEAYTDKANIRELVELSEALRDSKGVVQTITLSSASQLSTHGDTNSGGRNTRSPKRPKS